MKSGNGGLARELRLQIMLRSLRLSTTSDLSTGCRAGRPAVRELLRHGIVSVGTVIENAGVKSRDYGVLKAPKGVGDTRQGKR
jgi:hypothetical protein